MPAHILLAALLATPPVVAPTSKEPAVYATIKLGKENYAWDMAFSPDGKTLAYVTSLGKTMVLWDVTKKEVATTFADEGQEYPYWFGSMAWEPDGKSFVASRHSSVCRVDARTGKAETLYAHKDPVGGTEVYSVCYLPERKLIVSGGSDGLVRFWDTEKGQDLKAVRCVPDKRNYPLAVAVVPGANKVIVSTEHGTETRDETGQVRSVTIGWSMFAIDTKDYSVSTIPEESPVDQFMNIGVPPGGGEFAYGKEDRVVFTDAATLKTRTTGKCPIHPCQLLFTPNGRYLIAVGPFPIAPVLTLISRPGGIAVYDLATEKWIAHWQVRGEWPGWSVSYSEANNLLACTSKVNSITVWDMKGVIDPAAKPKKKD